MHIPKLLTMISLVTLGAGSISIQAQRPDTDMQATAREQMRQALEKLDAQNPATQTNTMPVKPKPVKKIVVQPPPPVTPPPKVVIVPAAPKPVTPPPAVVVAPAPAVQPKVVSVPEQPKPVVVVKKKAPPAKATGFSEFSPIAESPNTGNPPVTLVIPGENPVVAPGQELKRSDETKAREEVRRTLAETAPAAKMKAKTEAKSELKFPVEANMGGGSEGKMEGPLTLTPGSKEARLYELLDLYKADKISPAEYHDQRAKIIAEP